MNFLMLISRLTLTVYLLKQRCIRPCQTPLTKVSTKIVNDYNLKKAKEQNVNVESREKSKTLHVYFHKISKHQTWQGSGLG